MSVRIAPNSVRCAVILWLLLFLRSVWSPSKVTFTAITLLIQAFFKSYGQFSLVCYRDNNIKPCFSYLRMIKINSKPFVVTRNGQLLLTCRVRLFLYYQFSANTFHTYLYWIILKANGFSSKTKQMLTKIVPILVLVCYSLLFLSRFQIFRLIKYRIAKCIPFNVPDVAKKEFREER